MIISFSAKKTSPLVLALLFFCLFIAFDSCKKKRSEMGSFLFKHTHNPAFKDIDEDEFADVFKRVLKVNKSKLGHPQFIAQHYAGDGYYPVFVMNYMWNGDMNAMLKDYREAYKHGINPKFFQADKVKALMDKLSDKNAIKTTRDAYYAIAKLEMMAPRSLRRDRHSTAEQRWRRAERPERV